MICYHHTALMGRCTRRLKGLVVQAHDTYLSDELPISPSVLSNLLRLILLVRRGRIAVGRQYTCLSRHWRIESKNTDNLGK